MKSISIGWICFSALLLIVPFGLWAASDQVTVKAGLAYNSNPSRLADSVSGHWVVRSYVSSGINLFRFGKAVGFLHYQGGIERRLGTGLGSYSLEGTATNGLTFQVTHGPSKWVWVGIEARLKNRNVHRMPGSPGYLREDVAVFLKSKSIKGVLGNLYYRHSVEDFQAPLTSFASRAMGLGMQRPFWRMLKVSLLLGQTELRFDREAFSLHKDATGKLDSLNTDQKDVLYEARVSLQVYKKLLLLLTYAFQDNNSNSYGYDFQAQKLILMITKDFPYDLVAQLYGSLQWRHYKEAVIGISPDELQVDEYEHIMYIAKLARTITEHTELETQYVYKNASNQRERFYEQHLFSVSLNLIH